jgi:hypothetical protein
MGHGLTVISLSDRRISAFDSASQQTTIYLRQLLAFISGRAA